MIIYLAEKVNVDAFGPNVFQISLGVVLEVIGNRNPDGLFASLEKVLVNEAGNGATFSHACSVT